MNLFGYIKEYSVCTFAIPVYNSEKVFYTHNLDKDFKIISYSQIEFSEWLIPINNKTIIYYNVINYIKT